MSTFLTRHTASLSRLASVDGTILVWEIASQQSMARFKHPRGACITSIAWDAAGEELAYGGTQN